MVRAAAMHEGYVLRAAADPQASPRAAFARDFRARTYADVAELVADPAVEVVYIATPHQSHAPHAILAADHGKHVILEKPMALTLADCDAIVGAAERNKIELIVGHTHAFDPTVRLMHLLIASGAFGRLGMINCFNYTDFLYRPRRPEELDTEKGGGILFNQLPHQIDIARLLGGGLVKSVRAQTTVLDPARPTEGSCVAFLQFENGAAASLIYSGYDYFDSDEWHYWVTERGAPKSPARGAARRALKEVKNESRMRTEKYAYGAAADELPPYQPHFGATIATCALGDLRTTANGVTRYTAAGASELKIAPGEGLPGRREVLDDMANAIRGGRSVHDGRWGKATLEVALAIRQSAQEQREIALHHQVPVPPPLPAGQEDSLLEQLNEELGLHPPLAHPKS